MNCKIRSGCAYPTVKTARVRYAFPGILARLRAMASSTAFSCFSSSSRRDSVLAFPALLPAAALSAALPGTLVTLLELLDCGDSWRFLQGGRETEALGDGAWPGGLTRTLPAGQAGTSGVGGQPRPAGADAGAVPEAGEAGLLGSTHLSAGATGALEFWPLCRSGFGEPSLPPDFRSREPVIGQGKMSPLAATRASEGQDPKPAVQCRCQDGATHQDALPLRHVPGFSFLLRRSLAVLPAQAGLSPVVVL